MAIPVGDPEGYKLAFDEGKKAVAQQAETLKETRDRVGTLVSAAAVVAGLGAAFAFDPGRAERVSAWGVAGTVLAVLGFGAIAIAAVIIWWPFQGTFALDAGIIVGSYVEGPDPASLPEIHRELALHLANTGSTTGTCSARACSRSA